MVDKQTERLTLGDLRDAAIDHVMDEVEIIADELNSRLKINSGNPREDSMQRFIQLWVAGNSIGKMYGLPYALSTVVELGRRFAETEMDKRGLARGYSHAITRRRAEFHIFDHLSENSKTELITLERKLTYPFLLDQLNNPQGNVLK